MIFTDSANNIKIDLIDPFTCKLYALNDETKQLQQFNRMLSLFSRGNDIQIQFDHSLHLDEKYVLLKGDLCGAVSALCELGWINQSLRDDVMEQVTIMIVSQAKSRFSSERTGAFVAKLEATLGDIKQAPHSPAIFGGSTGNV